MDNFESVRGCHRNVKRCEGQTLVNNNPYFCGVLFDGCCPTKKMIMVRTNLGEKITKRCEKYPHLFYFRINYLTLLLLAAEGEQCATEEEEKT